MYKRFLYGKIVIAQIAALALTIFISSNFLFNGSTMTNANASVLPERQLSPVVAGATTIKTRAVRRAFFPTSTKQPTSRPTSTPTLIPTKVPTAVPANPTSVPTATSQSNLSGLESQTVTLINDERKRRNLGELGVDSALTSAARRHAKDMCDKNNFSHTGTDGSNFSSRAKDAGYSGFASGEVVGWNHTSADSIFHGWMESPPHRDIIMGSGISKIGIGWIGVCVVGVVGS